MNEKSRNPFLSEKAYSGNNAQMYDAAGNPVYVYDANQVMTVRGTINKTFILFGLLAIGALAPFVMLAYGINPLPAAIACAIAGFVCVIVAGFSKKNAMYLAPAYALFEGVFISSVSMYVEVAYGNGTGIVLQAVMGTLLTFGVCLALYRFRIIKVTERFKSIVIASMMAVVTYYLIAFLFSWLGGITPFHHGNSLMSIGFSLFLIVLAAANLLMDFSFIEEGSKNNLPKYMEWYSSMGLLITLVWLYLEILRLLSKLQSRN